MADGDAPKLITAFPVTVTFSSQESDPRFVVPVPETERLPEAIVIGWDCAEALIGLKKQMHQAKVRTESGRRRGMAKSFIVIIP